MSTPLITIPLSEYNDMIEIKDTFQKALDEKKAILFHDSYYPGHSGYPVHKFTIVNLDKLTEELNERIRVLKDEKTKIWYELDQLKSKPKKWWQL